MITTVAIVLKILLRIFKKITTAVVNFLKKPLAVTQKFSRANKFGVRARLRTPEKGQAQSDKKADKAKRP